VAEAANPASEIYAIGSPVVSQAVPHLDGKYFPDGHAQRPVAESPVDQARRGGAGGTLVFQMASKPNPDWG